ncbi:MAG: hypothetical protein Ct9H300mP13_8370 [Gammaproteobacteria bacterium]|nr:MAG: hypothetical protein Ct9H300mP13_8370 [Gammaproteobacteria bacterium]
MAWENLDDIISVEGIDVFFVAPGDFAASMGHIWDWQHREVQEKVDDAISRIVAAGHSAGTLATNETVERYAALGARFFFTVSQPWINAGGAGVYGSRRSWPAAQSVNGCFWIMSLDFSRKGTHL